MGIAGELGTLVKDEQCSSWPGGTYGQGSCHIEENGCVSSFSLHTALYVEHVLVAYLVLSPTFNL